MSGDGVRHQAPPQAADDPYRKAFPSGGGPKRSGPSGTFPEGFCFAPLGGLLHAERDLPMTGFNEAQQRALLSGCVDIHRRMAELEALIASSGGSSVFSEHLNDLSPAEIKIVLDSFAQMRGALETWLRDNGVPLAVRRTSLRWIL